MSFILDALKKSETERQRSRIPGLSDLPVVAQQPRASAWVSIVIVGLSIAIAVLGWAWWNASTPGEPLASAPEPAPETGPEPARVTAPTPAAPAPRASTRSLAGEVRQAARPAEPPQTPLTEPAPEPVVSAQMTVGELRSTGVEVPELTLELHVYSDDPAQRFVFINSSKYVEGDALQEGPRLLSITTEGAILSQEGHNFLLPQN